MKNVGVVLLILITGFSGCRGSLSKKKAPPQPPTFSIKERPPLTKQAAQAYFEEGLRYYAEGDLDRAISCFAEALKIDPNHTKARKMFVESLKKRAEEKEARMVEKKEEITEKKEEIIEEKKLPTPEEVKPEKVGEKLPPPEVKPPKERVVERISQEELRRFELVKDLKRRGMLDEAISEIELLLEDFPKTLLMDRLIYLRGELYFEKGEYENAERDYTEIIDFYEKSPLLYDAKVRVADTYFERGEYDEALLRYMKLEKELREITMRSPPEEKEKEKLTPLPTQKAELAAKTQLGIAETYRHKEEYINALIEYYELLKTYEDPKARAQALYYIGYIYDFIEEVRNFNRAIAAYERVIEEYPESPWTPYARERKAYIEENYL